MKLKTSQQVLLGLGSMSKQAGPGMGVAMMAITIAQYVERLGLQYHSDKSARVCEFAKSEPAKELDQL